MLIFAAVAVVKLYSESIIAACLTLLVIIWTAFASLIVPGEMKLDKFL